MMVVDLPLFGGKVGETSWPAASPATGLEGTPFLSRSELFELDISCIFSRAMRSTAAAASGGARARRIRDRGSWARYSLIIVARPGRRDPSAIQTCAASWLSDPDDPQGQARHIVLPISQLEL